MNFTPEQLLDRMPIPANEEKLAFVCGRTVAVTGGGGSIGSELCRQIAARAPRRLIVIDIYENNAFAIEQELVARYGEALDLRVYIASVRDAARIEAIFAAERPDLVLHAAAHKHVPLMETSPGEAIKNNIFGTLNTARAAVRSGAAGFVLISTDKAVRPSSIMGATKRICELLIPCFADSGTVFSAVRFGNVLGSNGSVVQLFAEQLRRGLPLTVTDQRMTRYFMTICEAAQLVLTAASIAEGGEIFVLDMGEPVSIDALAQRMILLAGDGSIRYTGLRPGERLHEVCLTDDPTLCPTECPAILVSRAMDRAADGLADGLRALQAAADKPDLTAAEAEAVLRTLVPDFLREDTE